MAKPIPDLVLLIRSWVFERFKLYAEYFPGKVETWSIGNLRVCSIPILTAAEDHWILTVNPTSIEVRIPDVDGVLIQSMTLLAADPDFFIEAEQAIKLALQDLGFTKAIYSSLPPT